ncbi:Heme oxygenase 1, chloroplastic [Capsicum chinense]|nr:Heme oxygenase 1, chloroplastic [Capsicum chinense]
MVLVSATTTAEKSSKRYPGEAKGFVEEMRFVAMKLHTKDQAKEGEKEAEGQPLAKWEPTVEGYLKFLVDSKLVYDTLEKIVEKAPFPECKRKGLDTLPFVLFRHLCAPHIVAEKILDKKELEFYKWDGDLSQLLQNVRDKLNKVAENWTREEKNHCLEETEKSFKFSGAILRLIFS